MSRPDAVECEGCGVVVTQQRLGAPRRKCDECVRVAERAATARWKKANPERHRAHGRESARRRRLDGRTT